MPIKSDMKSIQSLINFANKNEIKINTRKNDNYTAVIIELHPEEEKGVIHTVHYTKTGGNSFNKLTPRADGFLPYGGYFVTQNKLLREAKEWNEMLATQSSTNNKILSITINESFITVE